LERRFEGVGLGASIVQRLAELQQGTTAIASLPGTGTSAAVWLPIRNDTPRTSPMASLRH
jgi:signal transduction histidine kinase